MRIIITNFVYSIKNSFFFHASYLMIVKIIKNPFILFMNNDFKHYNYYLAFQTRNAFHESNLNFQLWYQKAHCSDFSHH